MEEWVGGLWHKYITRKANPEFDEARVNFDQVSKSVAMVFRALGGDVVKRVEAATGREYLTRKSFLQKISGDNQLVSLAWQDEESLRLPESLVVFNDKTLNYDLYIWLAVLAAHHNGSFRHWAKDNQTLVVDVLEKFPALHNRYRRLAKAFVAMRPPLDKLPPIERTIEQSIRNAILIPGSVNAFSVVNLPLKRSVYGFILQPIVMMFLRQRAMKMNY
jgi:nitric oxide reductase NorD protein